MGEEVFVFYIDFCAFAPFDGVLFLPYEDIGESCKEKKKCQLKDMEKTKKILKKFSIIKFFE